MSASISEKKTRRNPKWGPSWNDPGEISFVTKGIGAQNTVNESTNVIGKNVLFHSVRHSKKSQNLYLTNRLALVYLYEENGSPLELENNNRVKFVLNEDLDLPHENIISDPTKLITTGEEFIVFYNPSSDQKFYVAAYISGKEDARGTQTRDYAQIFIGEPITLYKTAQEYYNAFKNNPSQFASKKSAALQKQKREMEETETYLQEIIRKAEEENEELKRRQEKLRQEMLEQEKERRKREEAEKQESLRKQKEAEEQERRKKEEEAKKTTPPIPPQIPAILPAPLSFLTPFTPAVPVAPLTQPIIFKPSSSPTPAPQGEPAPVPSKETTPSGLPSILSWLNPVKRSEPPKRPEYEETILAVDNKALYFSQMSLWLYPTRRDRKDKMALMITALKSKTRLRISHQFAATASEKIFILISRYLASK